MRRGKTTSKNMRRLFSLRRIGPIGIDIVSRPDALSDLLPPLLLTSRSNLLLDTTEADVLYLVLLQAWQTSTLSPRRSPLWGVKVAQTGTRSSFFDTAAAMRP
jgi:hypothetical protein